MRVGDRVRLQGLDFSQVNEEVRKLLANMGRVLALEDSRAKVDFSGNAIWLDQSILAVVSNSDSFWG